VLKLAIDKAAFPATFVTPIRQKSSSINLDHLEGLLARLNLKVEFVLEHC
ncbi:hypothetical protein L195_g041061, partial [Trifolium pratense]